MRRLFTICLLALSATVLLVGVPTASSAGAKKASKPSITRVTPMRVSVGNQLTIYGRHFKAKRTANTVIFRAPSGRTAFAKPHRVSRTKLVVAVPHGVAHLVASKVTRFKLRVLAGSFSPWTARRLSPVIVRPSGGSGGSSNSGGPGSSGGPGGASSPGSPGGSGSLGGGVGPGACGTGGDWDADLLSNELEAQLKTNACAADSDGDGVEDGYEYKSAIDLNDDEFQDPNSTLPYPGKRPYPNPLYDKDANKDFDGDVLTLAEEQTLWRYTGVQTLFDLTYSDGEQYSLRTRDVNNRRVPTEPASGYPKQADFLAWASSPGVGYRTVMLSDGAPWWDHGVTRHPYALLDFNRSGGEDSAETIYYDFDNDGFLSDNERDEDADGLTNYDETHGRMTAKYWSSCYALEKPDPIEYAGTDVTDPDTDGDGVRDGADDQDHDDVPNVMELSRRAASGHWDAQRDCTVKPGLGSGNFTVAGGPLPNSSVLVTFVGELGGDHVDVMTADGSKLTGGTVPGVEVSEIRDGGDDVDAQQAVTITGAPTGGSFTLSLNGRQSLAIAYDATADAMKTALQVLAPADPKLNHSKDFGRVNPFNPCLPADWARTCTLHPGLEINWAPFDDSVNWLSLN